jgi:hypothetical protein
MFTFSQALYRFSNKSDLKELFDTKGKVTKNLLLTSRRQVIAKYFHHPSIGQINLSAKLSSYDNLRM